MKKECEVLLNNKQSFNFKLIPCVLPFSKDFEIGVPDSRLDISTDSERKCNFYISKSESGFWQPETCQFLKIEALAIL